MTSGFDERVEARLIGLRMASDAPNDLATITNQSSNISLSNETLSSQDADNRNSLSNPPSSNGSFSNNSSVTAKR